MRYWGKVIGLVLRLFSGIGFWGIVLGLLIGHLVNKVRGAKRLAWFANNQTRQTLFFQTTFQVMGHLTKSKGHVTEADIQIASLLMDSMQLHGDARSACFGRFDLIRIFLEIQI
nr:Organic solvent tolerance protein [Candidatus Pantoea persica]